MEGENIRRKTPWIVALIMLMITLAPLAIAIFSTPEPAYRLTRLRRKVRLERALT